MVEGIIEHNKPLRKNNPPKGRCHPSVFLICLIGPSFTDVFCFFILVSDERWSRFSATVGALNRQHPSPNTIPKGATGALVLADGSLYWGIGAGAAGVKSGELCFNTAMTGYQEILSDPSYAGQIITFTFPHIGTVGTNLEDVESLIVQARGAVLRTTITEPSNFRNHIHFSQWLKQHDLVAVCGVDTRKITRWLREKGAINGVVAHDPDGRFTGPLSPQELRDQAADCPSMAGLDLAGENGEKHDHQWRETPWQLGKGYGQNAADHRHVVVIDYGAKRNILRSLAARGCRISVVAARSSADHILSLRPDGVVLSNGPGDPAATAIRARPVINHLIASGVPLFGICLGHQILALTLGARTEKMHHGHRGANHPIKNLLTGRVEITSQNHGFVVAGDSLPSGVEATHVSLFDQTIAGLAVRDQPIFSVQYHPEASPGPHDSGYLFDRFITAMDGAS